MVPLGPRNRLQLGWNRLTLRRQLVLSLWLCTIPISAAGSALVLEQTYELAKHKLREDITYSLTTLALVMNDYLEENQAWLGQLAGSPSLRNLEKNPSQDLLNRARASFPNIELSVFRIDGTLVASNPDTPLIAQATNAEQRRRSAWFQRALKGDSGFALSDQSPAGESCLIQAEAIHNQGHPIGVLQACTAPEHIGPSSGISTLTSARASNKEPNAWLDLDHGATKGRGVLLVSKKGQLLLLHKQGKAVTENGRLSDPRMAQNSAWAEMAQAILKAPINSNQTAQYQFSDYFIAASPLGPDFTLAAIIDRDTALKSLREVAYGIASINLLALLISSIAIARISKPLLQPIDDAGNALRRISDGDFDVTLPCSPNNDIGRLFTYITTSAQTTSALTGTTPSRWTKPGP